MRGTVLRHGCGDALGRESALGTGIISGVIQLGGDFLQPDLQ